MNEHVRNRDNRDSPPGHVLESIEAHMEAQNFTLSEINRRLKAIEEWVKTGATAADLELIKKELEENATKLKAAPSA